MGELDLIEAIRATLRRRPDSRVVRWLGDDAAVIRADAYAAVSVDVMVDGTHFRLDGGATPADAGHRALAGALSDLAAMGAAPGEAYLSVVLPGGIADADVLALHEAAEALAAATGTTIAGGDLASGPVLTIAVTVIGWAARGGRAGGPRRRAPGRPRGASPARSAPRPPASRGWTAAQSPDPSCAAAISGPSPGWPRDARSPPRA